MQLVEKMYFCNSSNNKKHLRGQNMGLSGLSLQLRSTLDALRRNYMKWEKYDYRSDFQYNKSIFQQIQWAPQAVCRELQMVIANRHKNTQVEYRPDIKTVLQEILDSEYLETAGVYWAKFDEEMLFTSPEKSVAQAFIDEMPCSPQLDAIRRCIQNYIDGETDIINPPYPQ